MNEGRAQINSRLIRQALKANVDEAKRVDWEEWEWNKLKIKTLFLVSKINGF